MTVSIAAAIITRNGARTLPAFLDSVRPHVDEIVVLDTGSTDGTLDLIASAAREPGAPIRADSFFWQDDYAAARNRSFELATCDCIAWFDDDEVLEGGEALRGMLAERMDALYVRRVEVYTDDGSWPYWFGLRVARRGVGEWRGPIHEVYRVPVDASAKIAHPAIVRVLHRPLDAPKRHDYEQAARRALALEPSRKLLSVLAMARLQAGDFAEAAELFGRVCDPHDALPQTPAAGPAPETVEIGAHEKLSHCLLALGDNAGAWRAAVRGEFLMRKQRTANPFLAAFATLDAAVPVLPDDPTILALARTGLSSLPAFSLVDSGNERACL